MKGDNEKGQVLGKEWGREQKSDGVGVEGGRREVSRKRESRKVGRDGGHEEDRED